MIKRVLAPSAAVFASVIGLVLGWPSIPKAAATAALIFAACMGATVLHCRTKAILGTVQATQAAQGALWALSALPNACPKVLSALGSGGMRPPAALRLSQIIALHRPRVVLELGPGATSFLILRTAASVPYQVRLTSIEHDPTYHQRAVQMFEYLGLDCELILAPLEPWEGQGHHVEFYADDKLAGLPKHVDLLVIDGPPAHDGVPRRFPAFPVLRHVLSPGALIFVDDTDRPGDRQAVEEWLHMESSLKVFEDGDAFIVLEMR